jgi:hypothetical protein
LPAAPTLSPALPLDVESHPTNARSKRESANTRVRTWPESHPGRWFLVIATAPHTFSTSFSHAIRAEHCERRVCLRVAPKSRQLAQLSRLSASMTPSPAGRARSLRGSVSTQGSFQESSRWITPTESPRQRGTRTCPVNQPAPDEHDGRGRVLRRWRGSRVVSLAGERQPELM